MTEPANAQEIVLKSRGVLPIVLHGEAGEATTSSLRELLSAVRRARRAAKRSGRKA